MNYELYLYQINQHDTMHDVVKYGQKPMLAQSGRFGNVEICREL